MRKLFLIVLLLFAFNQSSFGFVEPKVHHLKNGVTLVTVVDPLAAINSSYVFVRTGSLFETPWMGAGLSHFLEHLVAGGTTGYRDESEYRSIIDGLGGASNAYTTYDHTAYYIKSPAKDTNVALEVLYEWVSSANWSIDEYKREKGVILKEMDRANNNVFRQIYQEVQTRFYKDSPYRYPVIGYKDQFLKTSSDDLRSFYSSHYVPENLVVVVGGNVSENIILKQVESSFGSLPKLAAPLRYHANGSRVLSSSQQEVELKSLKSNRVVIRYPITSFYGDDVYPLDLFAYILGNGEQSLLYKAFVTNQKLATSISVNSITPMADYGYFEINIETDAPLESIVEKTQRFIDQFEFQRLPKSILKKAKTQKQNEYDLNSRSLDGYIKEVGQSMMMGQNPLFFRYYANQFKSVNSHDINQIVKRYLTPKKRQVYHFKNKQSTTAKIANQVLAPVKITTKNNIVVITIPESNDTIFQVSIQFEGGITKDPQGKEGLGFLTSQLIGKKIKGITRDHFQNQFESRGASISSSLSHNNLTVSLTALNVDQDQLLPLFMQAINSFDVDPDIFEETKLRLIKSIQKVEESWFEDAFIKLKQVVFADGSPYQNPIKGTLDSVNNITLNDVLNYINARRTSSNITVIIQSKNPEPIETRVVNALPIQRAMEVDHILVPELARTELESLSLTQPVGVVLHLSPLKIQLNSLNQWLRIQLVDAILSGMRYPSGLLHSRLRGEELVYVVHTVPMRFKDQDFLLTYALTEPSQVALVNKIISQSFKEIRTDISQEQLVLAKSQVLFNRLSNRQDLASRPGEFNEYWTRLHYIPSVQEIESELNKITVNDIKATVNEAFLKSRVILFNSESMQGDDNNESLR
ncbi:MAG: insulinase family protein [Candidatus Margulisiibacteriota bacterium]